MPPARVTTATTPTSPVRVEAGPRTVRVAAVVPCFNRPDDLALLAADLGACRLEAMVTQGGKPERVEIRLSVVVVDNASDPRLNLPPFPRAIDAGLCRLAVNTGGSGGFNAGLAAALAGDPDYLWLVDSDARVEPDTLVRLVAAMERESELVVVGPSLADPESGHIYEIGGRVRRRTGRFEPVLHSLPEALDENTLIECDYVAACCALVRAGAAQRSGLMPDVFLNGDDVEWCVRLTDAAGGRIAALPSARARHPRFDRFAALPRYFGARNAFGPIDALSLGRRARFRRAVLEATRAANQNLMDRPDLAALHTRGLRDAARGIMRGLPDDLPRVEPARPLSELKEFLQEQPPGSVVLDLDGRWMSGHDVRKVTRAVDAALDVSAASRAPTRSLAALARRAAAGPRFDIAIVPAKGTPAHWLLARTMVECVPGGFVVRRPRRFRLLARAVWSLGLGAWYGVRLATGRSRTGPLPAPADTRALAPLETGATALTLSIVILSFNRRDAILQTLTRLRDSSVTRDAEIVVIDNGSGDGSPDAIREHAPWARLVALKNNEAIAGFNRGVTMTSGDVVLILDDDARPDPEALGGALDLLARRGDLGAVTLLPCHPGTGASEWPFGERVAEPTDRWPVMGCCNLVRRSVWLAVGGYEAGFFLYRNDTDLAMKILATGLGVHFNPAWRCEHDSPAASRKSARWCRLATRNWVWLARRHGRGWRGVRGAILGWAWAHKLSGLSPSRHWATLRGAAGGFLRPPPALPDPVRPDGRHFDALLRLRFSRRSR